MSKKILLVLFTAFFLSGCTLLQGSDSAATDVAPDQQFVSTVKPGTPSSSTESTLPPASLTPAEANSISSYEKSQELSTGDDVNSLEKDLNTTDIPDENLEDLLTK